MWTFGAVRIPMCLVCHPCSNSDRDIVALKSCCCLGSTCGQKHVASVRQSKPFTPNLVCLSARGHAAVRPQQLLSQLDLPKSLLRASCAASARSQRACCCFDHIIDVLGAWFRSTCRDTGGRIIPDESWKTFFEREL